jgi:cytochrome c oxidase subunit 3
MTPASTIDVSELEPHVLDHRSPIWWGNVLLLCIETTMFGLLVAAYFYLRMNFTEWPPPRPEKSLYATNPKLFFATANTILLVLSCIPMGLADWAALHRKVGVVKVCMAVMVLLGLGAIALRFYEFSDLKFRWDDNAYAGIVWTTLGMHLLHLITGTAENGIMCAWAWLHGLDDKHARDVRVGAVYWYWIAGIWLPIYVVIYFGARWL